MKVTFNKITDKGIITTEYLIKGLKCAGDSLAIDIVDTGWRAIDKAEYDSYAVSE